ncbi:unnamed protein product [Prorocentrum cordatum]|uniref:Ankyrin repeat domain-containing protein n=2 Tax=Prorocentrum cordatum TaxID=2364126 RepID=A0ABN9Q289_9DINO|nr:unnamed protein product [Polarella glacialis]
MRRGFVEFQQMRSGSSVRLVEDGRPRHPRQEGWPEQYHKLHNPSDYVDMQEGSYFSLGNKCADPSDARDDAALKLSKDEVGGTGRWSARLDKGAALLDAAKNGSPDLTREALAAGADVNFADENAWTALHEAARAGSAEVVSLLLEAGADPASRRTESPSEPSTWPGSTTVPTRPARACWSSSGAASSEQRPASGATLGRTGPGRG